MPPSFSIVVNTYNRAALLPATLDSLCRLQYAGQFEIIVVNGPSTDHSEQVIAAWSGRIRSARCDRPNLSVSRNVGICQARGEIVAFIDDDAIAEPEWLTQLAAAYDSAQVGAAGGIVYDHTGYKRQYEYATANRLGGANWAAHSDNSHLCFPGSFEFPYLQGTNASFRRSALLELGGFDEEFEYYLDETELCCRMIDAGYLVRQLPNAFVHHKTAPSAIRDQRRVLRHHYAIIKNKIYFSLKHGLPYLPPAEIERDNRNFIDGLARELAENVAAGLLPGGAIAAFEADRARAWRVGTGQAGRADWRYITPGGQLRQPHAFMPCQPTRAAHGLSIVLVSADYPPGHSGGIATFYQALAEGLAAQGHIVHVITRSADIDRVDLEQGVWVHRMVTRERDVPAGLAVPRHIWNWSATARLEAERIAGRRPVDLVEAPVWDAEGIAFLHARRWPLVTSLQTTLHFWLDSHPGYRNDAHWMAAFGTPMLALERQLMEGADAVRAISAAIRDEIETAYGFRFDPARLVVAPLGLASVSDATPAAGNGAAFTVLFVGRLEQRKGIDVLLAAIPAVLAALPQVRFRIVGDNTLTDHEGQRYCQRFQSRHAGAPWLTQVGFEGRIDDPALRAAYAGCDLFVAPSRFESFGLVFLEAMRAAKPVIGCRAGGMPEVVAHGDCGLLVAPGDAQALAQAILSLLRDGTLRRAMGAAGRQRFLDRFTAQHMALASAGLYRSAIAGAAS